MTFNELLTLCLVIGVPLLVGQFVTKQFGLWPGIGAGLVAAVACVTTAARAYRAYSRRNALRREQWKRKYEAIYRVITLPADEAVIKKPKGAEIRPGDYGWEAVPFRNDNLIYLQGLDLQWRVVWYAGFRPDQIEKVTMKPQSQYDWDKTWVQNAPRCPYPVQERETTNMGLPMPH